MGIEALGELIANQRYTEEERSKFQRIIGEFVQLYHDLYTQTWCNTKWRGVNTFKAPTDMWVYQELIHEIRPDIIIETGTCCGGSSLYMADVIRVCGLKGSLIITVDIDETKCNDKVKNDSNIVRVIGSSIENETYYRVRALMEIHGCGKKVMVILDSDHSKEHVLRELELYAPLVSPGSILIVEDTNTGGPREAVNEWKKNDSKFELNVMCEKYMLTFNRGGYFERKEEGK